MDAVTPLFAGLDLFGPAAVVVARANPVARVTRGFAGLRGLVTKHLGSRGATAQAAGVLASPTRDGLAALEGVFEVFKLNGGAYPLRDMDGRTWPDMILVEFDPGELMQDEDGCSREYSATFLGLSNPFEA